MWNAAKDLLFAANTRDVRSRMEGPSFRVDGAHVPARPLLDEDLDPSDMVAVAEAKVVIAEMDKAKLELDALLGGARNGAR